MWTIRRASIHLKNNGLSPGIARICSGKSEIARCYLENYSSGYVESEGNSFDGLLSSKGSLNTFSSVSKLCGVRTFSSQDGAKDDGEKDNYLEGFSKLETPHEAVKEATSSDVNDKLHSEDNDLEGFSKLVTPHEAVKEATSSDESGDKLYSEVDVDNTENDTDTDVVKKTYNDLEGFAKLEIPHESVKEATSSDGNDKLHSEDNDLEDFSKLETPHEAVKEVTSSDEKEDKLHSEVDVVDDIENDTETAAGKNTCHEPDSMTKLAKAILNAPDTQVSKIFDKWVEEGHHVTQTEISLITIILRKRRLFVKALQLAEWMESTKPIKLTELNYAALIDLTAKVHGLHRAQECMKKIPKSLRGELVYRTLLASCVANSNSKKSEEVFNTMKKLKFPVSVFACNQLLLLYKRTDKSKIASVLQLMEKENVKPSLLTYQMLIDVKGQSNDITGMEEIVETMKSQGIEPNTKLQLSLAHHYAYSGFLDKSEAILKGLEGGDLEKNGWTSKKAQQFRLGWKWKGNK